MVRKRDEAAPAPGDLVPRPAEGGRAEALGEACPMVDRRAITTSRSRARRIASGTMQVGEKIDHVDGMTVEEAEHQMATRLYQNTARVHFNQFAAEQGPLRPPADLRRTRDFARARALLQRAGECVSHHGDQWRAGTSRRCSRATRCSPGRRCWPKPNCRGAPMSARCACARSRRRISPAASFRSSRTRRTIRPSILDLDYWVLMPR